MATKKESAPGPDGIPYSFYRGAGGLGFAGFCSTHTNMCWKVVLYLRYLPKVEPVLIPKSSDVDNIGRIVRSPESFAPIDFV